MVILSYKNPFSSGVKTCELFQTAFAFLHTEIECFQTVYPHAGVLL